MTKPVLSSSCSFSTEAMTAAFPVPHPATHAAPGRIVAASEGRSPPRSEPAYSQFHLTTAIGRIIFRTGYPSIGWNVMSDSHCFSAYVKVLCNAPPGLEADCVSSSH